MAENRRESQVLPFQMAPGQQPHVAWPRVIEGLVIAAVTALATSWGTVQVLRSELEHVRAQQQEFKTEVRSAINELRRDFYRPRYESQAAPLLQERSS